MYIHKVQYYETDKMGITHHANYIKWMEEARVFYLEECGYGYDRIESEGIIMPVVSINGNYKRPTTFPDIISINVSIKAFNGVKLTLLYEMTSETGQPVFIGETVHCFLNSQGRPSKLKEEHEDIYRLFMEKYDQGSAT